MSLTHFPHGVSSFGIPVLGGGGVPATFGIVYFVDADIGSDGNRGLGPDDALKTVAKAYSKCRTNKHDVIVLSGVGAHTLTDELTVAKNRVHFVGLGGGSRYIGQRTRFEMGVTTGSAIAIVQVTGVGCTFTNIKFRSVDTLATSLYAVADGGEFTQFTNCSFEKATDLNQATAAEFLCNSDSGYYKNCTFGNMIYQVSVARGCVLVTRETITGKVARDCIFEDCLFLNNTSSATAVHVKTTLATDVERFMIFKSCIFMTAKLSSATQTNAIHGAAALTVGEILCHECTCQNVTGLGVVTGLFTSAATSAADGAEAIQATA